MRKAALVTVFAAAFACVVAFADDSKPAAMGDVVRVGEHQPTQMVVQKGAIGVWRDVELR